MRAALSALPRRGGLAAALVAGVLGGAVACESPRTEALPADSGREDPAPAGYLLIDGHDVAVDVPVDHRYDATVERCWFTPERVLPRSPAPGCDQPKRTGPRRGEPRPTVDRVDLFVIHYDAAVTSSRCFEVLHDVRGLSVHFLLDVDGTLYQTCDLSLRARHAGSANDRSIGIEIAHPGAWPDENRASGYYRGANGKFTLFIPEQLRPPPGGPFEASRPGYFKGRVNGRDVVQVDYTDAQYETLAQLTTELARVFPGIERRAPRDASGAVRQDALSADELAAFGGIVGHHHISGGKIDPGPAFDWERLLGAIREP